MRLFVKVALLTICVNPVFAAEETAEEFTARSFAAMKNDGFDAVADYMHPDALVKFQEMIGPVFVSLLERNDTEAVYAFFGQGITPDELREMSADKFFRGMFRVIAEHPDMKSAAFNDTEIIGSVIEDDLTHVVIRVSVDYGDATFTEVDTVTVAQDGDGWGLLLTGEMEGFAQAMQNQAGR